MTSLEQLANDIGKMADAKNESYGNAVVGGTVEILSVLFPNGIPKESYEDLPVLVNIINKMLRISHGNKSDFHESPYRDIAGYALLGCRRDEHEN